MSAIIRAQYIKTFTFTKDDWEAIERGGKDAYIFVCHERRDTLPQQVQEYIKWGEMECRTRIRGTRGGGGAVVKQKHARLELGIQQYSGGMA